MKSPKARQKRVICKDCSYDRSMKQVIDLGRIMKIFVGLLIIIFSSFTYAQGVEVAVKLSPAGSF